MQQGWLQVSGLLMDFTGVMLLAYEWLVAYRAQRREEMVDEQGVRQLKTLAFAQANVRDERMAAHYRMVAERAQDRIREQGSEIRRQGHIIRMPVFVVALLLIAGGFLLQVAGSWPGGSPALGITPGG
jgi:hypothetical protein